MRNCKRSCLNKYTSVPFNISDSKTTTPLIKVSTDMHLSKKFFNERFYWYKIRNTYVEQQQQ